MKNRFSRILALILALCVLSPAVALADGKDSFTLTLSDVTLAVNTTDDDAESSETNYDLPLTYTFLAGWDAEAERGTIVSHANIDGKPVAGGGSSIAYEDGKAKYFIDGMEYGLAIPGDQYGGAVGGIMALSYLSGRIMVLNYLRVRRTPSPEIIETLPRLDKLSAVLNRHLHVASAADILATLLKVGIVFEEIGEEEITLCGETRSAVGVLLTVEPAPLDRWLDAIDPDLIPGLEGIALFYRQYMIDMFKDFIVDFEPSEYGLSFPQLDETFLGVSGAVYAAEDGALFDITLTLSNGEQTHEIPFTFSAFADGQREATEAFLLIEREDGSFSAEIHFDMDTDGDSVFFSAALAEESFGTAASAEMQYVGTAVLSDDANLHEGYLTCSFNFGSSDPQTEKKATIQIAMDAGLEVGPLPEGPLLELPGTPLNPLEADDESMSQFASDRAAVQIQGLGVLMQNPAFARLLTDISSGSAIGRYLIRSLAYSHPNEPRR